MSLPEHIVRIAINLSQSSDEFNALWKYYEDMANEMVDQILSSDTDLATREILVRVHEVFRQEVVDLPRNAVKQLKTKEPGT